MRFGGFKVPASLQQYRQVVMGLGIFGLQPERLQIRGRGGPQPGCILQTKGNTVMGLVVVGL